jgi:hypothetical protein
MTTEADLRRVMDSISGLQEHGGPDGHDGNLIKIWDDLQPDMQRNPYCAATVCYLWKHAGRPYDAIDHPWGFSYCPDAVEYFKRKGMWSTTPPYEFGDTIFYLEGGIAGHTGAVVHDDLRIITAFEGNTSPDGGFGSQNDGGGCYYRHRPHGSFVMGVAKTSRWLKEPAPTVVRKSVPILGKKVPPKGVGNYKVEDTDMAVLVKAAAKPDVFISNGVTKRHVTSQTELKELVATGVVPGTVHVVSQATIDALVKA